MLTGDDGNDQLWGGDNDDRLYGGAGADILSGGVGNDLLTGGDGADVFVFWTGGGTDHIADFADGTDLITLNASPQTLTITGTTFDTIVTVGDLTLLIDGVDSTLIDLADFTFA